MILFLNFFLYVVINAFTPGPGNILALNTVTTYGVKQGKPLFYGIFTGYYVVQILCAVAVIAVGSLSPDILTVIKYCGALYMLYLAYHVLRSQPGAMAATAPGAFFVKGFLLQFVNVKIYLFGITAITGYILSLYSAAWSIVLAELFIATVGTIATGSWIWAGQRFLNIYTAHYRLINIILALLLLECVYSILVS